MREETNLYIYARKSHGDWLFAGLLNKDVVWYCIYAHVAKKMHLEMILWCYEAKNKMRKIYLSKKPLLKF